MSNLRSIQFVSFRFDLFRFVLFRFVSICFVSICFVSFRFVSFCFDLFRFVPFRFCFVSHFTGTRYTQRKIQKGTWQKTNTTKNFDFTTFADRHSNDCYPTGVVKRVKRVYRFPTFSLTAKRTPITEQTRQISADIEITILTDDLTRSTCALPSIFKNVFWAFILVTCDT